MKPCLGSLAMLALVLRLLLAVVSAAGVDQQLSQSEAPDAQARKNTLLTYYFDAS